MLIITPNPALDRVLTVPHLRLATVRRVEHVLLTAGGKGLNVARVAHALDEAALVCAPLGGLTGQLVAQLAAAAGLRGAWSWHEAGETRICTLVVDPAASRAQGDATALNEYGPCLSHADWQRFVETVLAAATTAKLATISGSLPPGVEPDWLAALISELGARGVRVFVDTSGPALLAAIAARPYAIKVNNEELGAALGQPVETMEQAQAALLAVRARGIALAAVTLGPIGALAADADAIWWAAPPALTAISSVGCGDALLAGLCIGFQRGETLPEALRLAVACGAADALTSGAGHVEPAEVARLRDGVTLRQL